MNQLDAYIKFIFLYIFTYYTWDLLFFLFFFEKILHLWSIIVKLLTGPDYQVTDSTKMEKHGGTWLVSELLEHHAYVHYIS